MTAVAGRIASNGPLREAMPVDEAAAVLRALTSPELHHVFRVRCG